MAVDTEAPTGSAEDTGTRPDRPRNDAVPAESVTDPKSFLINAANAGRDEMPGISQEAAAAIGGGARRTTPESSDAAGPVTEVVHQDRPLPGANLAELSPRQKRRNEKRRARQDAKKERLKAQAVKVGRLLPRDESTIAHDLPEGQLPAPSRAGNEWLRLKNFVNRTRGRFSRSRRENTSDVVAQGDSTAASADAESASSTGSTTDAQASSSEGQNGQKKN